MPDFKNHTFIFTPKVAASGPTGFTSRLILGHWNCPGVGNAFSALPPSLLTGDFFSPGSFLHSHFFCVAPCVWLNQCDLVPKGSENWLKCQKLQGHRIGFTVKHCFLWSKPLWTWLVHQQCISWGCRNLPSAGNLLRGFSAPDGE